MKPNYTENKYRYNGGTELQNKEFSDGSGLELYDANARMYDPQIGRFGGIDALGGETSCLSPYQFAYNDPVIFNDPTGMKVAPKGGFAQYSRAEQEYINQLANPMDHQDDWGIQFMGSGGGGGGYDENGNLITSSDYSAKWAEIIQAVENGDPIPGFTPTKTTRYYDYSNISGSGIFETPNNDGLYTEQVGENYHFIGATDKTTYTNNGDANNRESNGWETARTVVEISDISFETTEQGITGAQRLGNAIGGTESAILKGGGLGKIAGTGLGFINIGTTIASGLTDKNGWQNHHTADIAVSAVEIGLGLFETTSPVGWAFGAAMFVGDLVSEHYTGHTITENLFDN